MKISYSQCTSVAAIVIMSMKIKAVHLWHKIRLVAEGGRRVTIILEKMGHSIQNNALEEKNSSSIIPHGHTGVFNPSSFIRLVYVYLFRKILDNFGGK